MLKIYFRTYLTHRQISFYGHIMWLSGLSNYTAYKSFVIQTLLWSLELLIQSRSQVGYHRSLKFGSISFLPFLKILMFHSLYFLSYWNISDKILFCQYVKIWTLPWKEKKGSIFGNQQHLLLRIMHFKLEYIAKVFRSLDCEDLRSLFIPIPIKFMHFLDCRE